MEVAMEPALADQGAIQEERRVQVADEILGAVDEDWLDLSWFNTELGGLSQPELFPEIPFHHEI